MYQPMSQDHKYQSDDGARCGSEDYKSNCISVCKKFMSKALFLVARSLGAHVVETLSRGWIDGGYGKIYSFTKTIDFAVLLEDRAIISLNASLPAKIPS